MKPLFPADSDAAQLTRKEKWLYWLIILCFATLFIPNKPVVPNGLIGCMLILSFSINTLREKWQLLLKRKEMLLMILFFLLHVLSAAFSANRNEALYELSTRVPLLIFPLAIGTIEIRYSLKERMIYSVSVITTVFAVISLVLALRNYVNVRDSGVLYNDSLTVFFNVQSIYMAMVVNLAILGFIYLIAQKSKLVKHTGLAYLAIFILFVYHFMLASRSAMILLYGGLFAFAVYYIINKRKLLEGVTLVLGLFIGGFILYKFFPKTVQRFQELAIVKFNYSSKGPESHYNMKLTEDQWGGANTRLALWSCGWELANQKLFTGFGIGDRKEALLNIYRQKNFELALRTGKNVHNNYLDVLITFGVGGLALFIFAFVIMPLRSAYRAKDVYGFIAISAFIISIFFDVYCGRSFSCILLAFYYSFAAATHTTVKA